MKKVYIFLVAALMPLTSWCAGWPASYSGVLLQGFEWDNYDDTGWQLFMDNADELADAFDLIWIPNSGRIEPTGRSHQMGYTPVYWFDHNSCFGSMSQLRQMIEMFRERKTGFLMDLVLNHKEAVYDWVYFADESYRGHNVDKTFRVTWDNENHTQIVKTDECVYQGYVVGGGDDTGENFDGARDLDHTNVTTQLNSKTYIDFLINELGYAGFRYDETKGYAPYYTGMYSNYGKQMFGVGEYWDGNTDVLRWWLNETKWNGQIQSATFDYCLKYRINEAFNNDNWSALSDKGLAADTNYSRWAVTFLDNHDTGRDGYQKVSKNVVAANAFILALPGTPCIFLPHYLGYKNSITNCIKGRRAAGVTNTSEILTQRDSNGGYILEVQGLYGKVYLQLGPAVNNGTPAGYQLVQGGTNYKYFISTGIDWRNAPKCGILPTFKPTDYPSDGKLHVFVKAPTDPSGTCLYAWDANGKVIGDKWPGTNVASLPYTMIGGAKWYYRTFSQSTVNVIINNSYGGETNQTKDIKNITSDTFLYYPGNEGHMNEYKDETTATKKYIGYQLPAFATNVEEKICCYLETDDYTTPYIYTWDNKDKKFSSTWPGTKMELVGTSSVTGKKVYRWTGGDFDLANMPMWVIFNDGRNGGKQTYDICFVNGGYYTLDGLIARVDGAEDPEEIGDVYIMGEVDGVGGWYANSGQKMNSVDGHIYTAHIKTEGMNGGYSYFSFSRRISESSEWDPINMYRFGAVTDDPEDQNVLITEGMLGEELLVSAEGMAKAFQIGAGDYNLKLDLDSRTLVVTEGSIYGDVNGDGFVNVTDVNLVVSDILTTGGLTPAYDINDDGIVNVTDVNLVVSIILTQHD